MSKKKDRKGKGGERPAKRAGKWIDGLEPSMPADEAARLVLRARLKAVERVLPAACDDWRDDPELVHQLRVCTRRAAAAVRGFTSRVDAEAAGRVHKRLKKLRRAAADARASDVLAVAFERRRDEAPPTQRALLEDLLAWNGEMRETAQRRLRKAKRRHPPSEMRQDRKRLVRSTRRENAAPQSLASLADDVLATLGRELCRDAHDVSDLESLHRLRLSAKRLRYGLEIFRCCLGDAFGDIYGQVTSMQEQLGAINDAGEFADTVEAFASSHDGDHDDDWRSAAKAIEADLRREADEGVRRFLHDWRDGRWAGLIAHFGKDVPAEPTPRVECSGVEPRGFARARDHGEASP